MTHEMPLVSVLMTAFNREEYIAESIESVLASTYANFELIIVDDCSADCTLEIAKNYEKRDHRVKVYANEKNLTDYPNRNKAASYAQGKYIKYLDSDDIIYPHGLEVMVRCMEQFPNSGLGVCRNWIQERPFPFTLSPIEAYETHYSNYRLLSNAPGSTIIKRDIYNKVNGFSGINQIGDLELWLKIAAVSDVVLIPAELYWDRIHNNKELNKDPLIRRIAYSYIINLKALQTGPLNSTSKKIAYKRLRNIKVKTILKLLLKLNFKGFFTFHQTLMKGL